MASLGPTLPARALAALFAGTLCATAPAAATPGYPARPVRMIVPYPAGGFADTFMRSIGPALSESLGQQIVVDNRPGASQMIGAQLAARSAPDGYTLFFGSVTSLAINPGSQKNPGYDPLRDFAPVTLCFHTPFFLVVNPALPVASVKDLIAHARARPRQLSYASIGPGSSLHLAAELFKSMTGVDIVHVPYKGTAPGMSDVIAGQVHVMFDAAGLTYARTGKVRVLAVTAARRSTAAPEVPTVAEAGVPGYEASIWFGIVAPAGTPTAIVERLSAETGRAVMQPALAARFAGQGMELAPGTPAAFASLIRAEIPKWGKVIRDARITAE